MAKDRSGNPEVIYGDEFAEVALTGHTKGQAYKTGKEPAPPQKPAASQNFWLVLWATRVLMVWRPAASLAGFQRAFEAACLDRPTPKYRSVGWMGSEAGSLIYLPGHFLCWFAVYLVTGMEAAREWCRFTLAMLETCATPEGRCGLVGQRSAKPGIDGPGWHDALLDISRGGNGERFAPLNRKGARVPMGNREWIWKVLAHWREEIAALGATVPRGVAAFEVLRDSPLKIRTEYRWAHRPDGTFVAVWVDSQLTRADIHASTFPVLARVRYDDGSMVTLPRGGGKTHQRGNKEEGGDHATCTLDGSRTLRYTARRSKPSPDALELPAGPLVFRSSWERLEGFP